jgi:hypothetical protein
VLVAARALCELGSARADPAPQSGPGGAASVQLVWQVDSVGKTREGLPMSRVRLRVLGALTPRTRLFYVGKFPAGCSMSDEESPGSTGTGVISKLSCYSGGYGHYVVVERTADSKVVVRSYGQAEALPGAENPPEQDKRTIAVFAVPKAARFTVLDGEPAAAPR